MAMTIQDWNELRILDDLFPIEVGVESLDGYIFNNMLTMNEMIKNLRYFLLDLDFSFHAYSTLNNCRRISDTVRKRCKYSSKRLSTWDDEFYSSTNVWIPSKYCYQILFSEFGYYYLSKWKKIKSALEKTYDVIKPYDMTLTETENNILDTDTVSKTTHNYTDTDNVIKDDEDITDKIYGFNSTGGVNSDSSSTKRQMTSSGTDSGTKDNTIGYDSTRKIDRKVTRTGNTGNITSQEMIEKELKLREYLIGKVIYKDFNEFFTLRVY